MGAYNMLDWNFYISFWNYFFNDPLWSVFNV